MSFRCDLCGKPAPVGSKMRKTPMETREKIYPNGAKGIEVVKEIKICENCAEAKQPKRKKVKKPALTYHPQSGEKLSLVHA